MTFLFSLYIFCQLSFPHTFRAINVRLSPGSTV